MSNLQIYNEKSINLSPISFVNDIQNHLKIRDLDTDSAEFKNKIAVFFTKTCNFLGIKEAILDINKVDIFQMLIMKYKGLSLEELSYAFKLERYGQISPKTQHYQLINADYISQVLDKYVNWKVSQRKNNISTVKLQPTMSEDEKIKKENEIVVRFIEKYKTEKLIEDEHFYIYDILDKRGLMNKDLDYKNSVKEDAIYLLTQEYSGKKASSMDELKSIKSKLKLFKVGSGGEIVRKCKTLVLEEFFRNLFHNEKNINSFVLQFKA